MADSENEEYLTYSGYGSKRTIARRFINAALLKEKNQPIALGSASKKRPILEKTGNYFDAIVDGNDVSNAKPDQRSILDCS
jgi:beta-phosphoglucomutase